MLKREAELMDGIE